MVTPVVCPAWVTHLLTVAQLVRPLRFLHHLLVCLLALPAALLRTFTLTLQVTMDQIHPSCPARVACLLQTSGRQATIRPLHLQDSPSLHLQAVGKLHRRVGKLPRNVVRSVQLSCSYQLEDC